MKISTSRFITLNNNIEQNGVINRIRPINVQSNILKLLEKRLYYKFHEEIIKKLYNVQIGFISVIDTEVNLIRLREKSIYKNEMK